MPVTQQLLKEKLQVLEIRSERSFPGLLQRFPMAPYLSKLRTLDPYYQYEAFHPAIPRRIDRIRSGRGQEAVALYQKIALCNLMSDALAGDRLKRLPDAIRQVIDAWFDRIVEDFDKMPDSYYDLDRPLWPLRKDLSVCGGRATPIGGAWVVESRLMPRQNMIRHAEDETRNIADRGQGDHSLVTTASAFLRKIHLDRLVRWIRRLNLRLRGPLDTCYVIHTIERNIRDLNAEEMRRGYRNIANLLQYNEHVWGVHRASWFLDPVVSEMSPDLAFFMKDPVEHGAELYDGGPCSADDTQKATMFSPVRTRLYQEGKYHPRSYFCFWSRSSVIEAFGGA